MTTYWERILEPRPVYTPTPEQMRAAVNDRPGQDPLAADAVICGVADSLCGHLFICAAEPGHSSNNAINGGHRFVRDYRHDQP